MTSIQPYLIRAVYDWIVDNGWTPYLVVEAERPGVIVPQAHVHDGRIVLNVTPRAVRNFGWDADVLSFDTRFGGVSFKLVVPAAAIRSIHAQENGQGLNFPSPDEAGEIVDAKLSEKFLESVKDMRKNKTGGSKPATTPKGGRPALRIVPAGKPGEKKN